MNYATPLQVLFNFLLYVILLLVLHKTYNKPGSKSTVSLVFSVLLVLVYCLFAFWGPDYFHYEYDFYEIKRGATTNLEDIYDSIVLISPTYFVFRLIVWGSALLCLFLLFKKTRSPFDLILLIFVTLYLPWFSYARVSLCMAILFLGLGLTVSDKRNNPLLFIIGILLIYFSTYFHKSAYFGAFVAVASLFLKGGGKWRLIIIIVLIPIAIYILNNFMAGYLYELSAEEGRYETVTYYIDKADRRMGLGEVLNNILQRTPYYLIVFLYIKLSITKEFDRFPKHIKLFANASVITILSATLFLFDFSINTYVFYYRFLNFAMIPSVIFISYCIKESIYPTLLKWIYNIGLASTIYTFAYVMYMRLGF